MPLSEREQRLLDQIERDLESDHRFAAVVRTGPAGHDRAVTQAIIGITAGVTLVLIGLVVSTIVSIVGFLVIVATAMWMTTSTPRRALWRALIRRSGRSVP